MAAALDAHIIGGSFFGYAAESTAGTMPTTGVVKLSQVTSLPATGEAPPAVDMTRIGATENTESIPGLKGLGTMAHIVNNGDTALTEYETMVSAYNEAATGGKGFWFFIGHEDMTKCEAYKGIPSGYGTNGGGAADGNKATFYTTVGSQIEWVTKPTFNS